jgi:hypothetical protein
VAGGDLDVSQVYASVEHGCAASLSWRTLQIVW